MDSREKFAALEAMCREKAAFAKREMDYWLAEANEWKLLRGSSSTAEMIIPIQLDWCAASDTQMPAEWMCQETSDDRAAIQVRSPSADQGSC
jgi:hypothetical protein